MRTFGPHMRALASLLVVLGWMIAPAVAHARPAPDVVVTDAGAVRGIGNSQYRQFQGIPYAAPPVGPLRWRPPVAPAPWDGVRDATRPGPDCPQGTGGNEDCLYLNVWAPVDIPARLPVLVWIHGGSLSMGSGAQYGAEKFLTKGDGPLLVVTINYRLGTLGYLADKSLEEPNGDVGNYGFMDQQLALDWVHRNIAAFGGDPDQVTIAGESAGGQSVCTQLAAPGSDGLYRAAIMQSGPCMWWKTKAQAESAGADAVAKLGCAETPSPADCLRALPVERILAVNDQVGGTVGTPFLPESPWDRASGAKLPPVPVIYGANHDERALWTYLQYGIPVTGHPLTPGGYRQALTTALADQGNGFRVPADQIDAVTAQYPLSDYPQPVEALTRAWSDLTSCLIAREGPMLARRGPAYVYEFADPNPPAPPSPFPLGAFHAGELAYLWNLGGTPVIGLAIDSLMMTEEQRALSDQMVRYWSRFVIAGTPDPADLPAMPERSTNTLMSLRPNTSGPIQVDAFNTDHRCDFWSRVIRMPY
ncbi:carboxylesterase/lipase family protein [Nocardia arthritidis]|nr:carboxylesterase family protein [Nocardia arthritidis]